MTSPQRPSASEVLQIASEYIKTLPERITNETQKTIKDFNTDFQKHYLNSGLTRYIDDYIRRAVIITILTSIATFSLTIITLRFLINQFLAWSLLTIVGISLGTTIIVTGLTIFFLVYYPYYKTSEAKSRLDDGLIYFLSYMAVLSASGMSVERILDRMSEVENNPPLVHLAKKFLMNVKLFGMDVRTALKDIEDMSPSPTLAKELEGIRTAIATSGDLKNLLMYEVDRQLNEKREKLKAKMNTLVYIGEIYVAMMVITPTIFILVISILSVMGRSMGTGAATQLNVIVFLGLPILGAVFTVLLDQTLGREE